MTTDVDVAVVGAGLMGAATAWAATRRGLSATVFEQFAVGHHQGSSHGSARIFRHAYDDALYVGMTGQARELWAELERQSGTQVLRVVGGVDHGANRAPHELADRLAEQGIPHELISAAEATERWPGMVFSTPVLFHPGAGVIDAAAAVRTMLAGAAIPVYEGASATVEVVGDVAVVRAGDITIRARRVVLAAGAWVAELLGGLITGRGELPELRVSQQQTACFPRVDPAAGWPTIVHKDALNTYALPAGSDAPGGVKVGEHDGGSVTSTATRNAELDPAASERLVRYVSRWLPGLVPEPYNENTCLYTSTASSDFVLDRVGPIVVCSPCSGHGAKFTPLIGELATDLCLDKPPAHDRFALRR